jgi:hypothetical protein
MEVTTFTCSICGESSTDICVACTKDTCANHLCERCKRCSDCCVCEVRLVNHHENNGKVLQDVRFQESEPEPNLSPEASAQEEADEA